MQVFPRSGIFGPRINYGGIIRRNNDPLVLHGGPNITRVGLTGVLGRRCRTNLPRGSLLAAFHLVCKLPRTHF
jgi:hypothetical protein